VRATSLLVDATGLERQRASEPSAVVVSEPLLVPSRFPLAEYELPRLVQLAPNLWAACFVLMKLLPARHILDCAEAEGRLDPDTHIIETSSGTFGLALAMIAATRKMRFTLVSDPIIDGTLRRRLLALGVSVEVIQPRHNTTIQQLRLDRLNELLAQAPKAFWPNQYGNAENPGAYARLAGFLVRRLGEIDCLVGGVGSGGSMCGTSTYLRSAMPHLQAVGVDSQNSVSFGQIGGPHLLRGIGNWILPRNIDHTVFDEVSWVPDGDAFSAMWALHRDHALYMGATSGAAFLVARWWARAHPDAKTVVLFADEGHRYADTYWDQGWLSSHVGALSETPDRPLMVGHPRDCLTRWTHMQWRRRQLAQVIPDAHDAGAAG
jgi:cysteine synthase